MGTFSDKELKVGEPIRARMLKALPRNQIPGTDATDTKNRVDKTFDFERLVDVDRQ